MRSSKRKSFVKKRIRKEKLKLRKENIKQFNIDVISYSNKIRELLIKNATKAEKKLLNVLKTSNLKDKLKAAVEALNEDIKAMQEDANNANKNKKW